MDTVINSEARFDWWAATLAGLIAGGTVWLLSHGIPWFTSGMVSPTLMGRDLKPPGAVDAARSTLTVVLHIGVSLAYALIIGAVVSRLRGLWGLAAGGVLGLVLYLLNFAAFAFLGMSGNELSVLVTHFVFGAVTAGAYKGLASRRDIHSAQA